MAHNLSDLNTSGEAADAAAGAATITITITIIIIIPTMLHLPFGWRGRIYDLIKLPVSLYILALCAVRSPHGGYTRAPSRIQLPK